jgi:hypothetical protein
MGALNEVLDRVNQPEHAENIKRASFLSALDGIRTGQMTYSNDPILPMIETEMATRVSKFQNMTKAEEGELLSLSDDQKKLVADNDRKLKNEYLAAAPHITHGTVKNNEKY